MNYLYITSLFLLLIGNIACEKGLSLTNYTMSFFQNLEKEPCKNDSDCPDYSNVCDKDNGYCNLYMFCHKYGNCLKLSLYEFDVEYNYQWPYYRTESYDFDKLNMNSCNLNIKNDIKKQNSKYKVDKLGSIDYDNDGDWGIFEDCKYLQSCNESKTPNTNCFSGKCNKQENMCETDNDNPGYVCTTFKNLDELSIKCLLMNHEKCTNNYDCLSNVCDSNAKICVTKDSKLDYSHFIILFFNHNWYYIFGAFLLIIILIIVVPRIYIKMKKPKEIVLAKMDY